MNADASEADVPPAGDTLSWRELAVARSLDPARVRAENRVQRFLDAARELMSTPSEREFTVQEVVERSGQSLRSFYQYFTGKYELLLALFEESVRATADHLREHIADESDPVERLHHFVIEYYGLCQPVSDDGGTATRPTPAMAEFAQQLLTSHPKEASRAFVPLVSLFEELLDEAAAAGAVRADVRRRQVVGVVLQTIMFNAFAATISGSSVHAETEDMAEDMWHLILGGIGTPARG